MEVQVGSTKYKSIGEWKEARLKKKLAKPLRTVVHPTRIIAYGVQLAIAIFMFNFLRNHFMMLILTVMAAAPVADLVSYIFLYRGIDVKLTAPVRNVSRFSLGYLELAIDNRSFLVSLDCQVKLDAYSTFYGGMGGSIISLPCSPRTVYKKHIPIRYSMNGSYRFEIPDITIRDFLGFISVKKEIGATAEVAVYPDRSLAVDVDMSDMNRGMTESEETIKKGHDFSDVSDVREYIPGDKLMSIHWKLSAKRDILMVKDRVSMSDQQMVILTELSGLDEEVDEILTLSYAVIERLVQDQTYVRLMWWNEGAFAFEERQIMSMENLKEAFSDMYYSEIYSDSEKTRGYMLSIHPELKAYIKVCSKDGQADVVVVEQD